MILITESTMLILPQTNFSVKVKGQPHRGRQIDKGTGTDRETHNTFIASLTSEEGTNWVIDKSRRHKNVYDSVKFICVNNYSFLHNLYENV